MKKKNIYILIIITLIITNAKYTKAFLNWVDSGSNLYTNGYVSIGTTTPIHDLNIYGTHPSILFSGASGNTYKWDIGMHTDGSFRIASSSNTGTNDRFIIDSAGKISIGTSGLAPKGYFHINTGTGAQITPISTADDFVVQSDSVVGFTLMTRDDTQHAQMILGSINDTFGGLLRWNTTALDFTIGAQSPNGAIQFTSGNGVEAMRLTATQRLGIGTTTPRSDLAIGSTTASFIMLSTTATSTLSRGINIKSGCFSINDQCVSLTGPQGPTGATGPQGPPGESGTTTGNGLATTTLIHSCLLLGTNQNGTIICVASTTINISNSNGDLFAGILLFYITALFLIYIFKK